MGGSFHGELLVITRWYTQALTNQLQGMSSLCFAVSLYALLLNNVEYQSVEAAPSQASQGELRLAAWLELSSAPPLAPELSSRPIDTWTRHKPSTPTVPVTGWLWKPKKNPPGPEGNLTWQERISISFPVQKIHPSCASCTVHFSREKQTPCIIIATPQKGRHMFPGWYKQFFPRKSQVSNFPKSFHPNFGCHYRSWYPSMPYNIILPLYLVLIYDLH